PVIRRLDEGTGDRLVADRPTADRDSAGGGHCFGLEWLELAVVRLLPLAIRLLGLRVRRIRGRERRRGSGQREGRYQAGCTPELTHAHPPGNPCRHSRPTPVIIKHPESPNR